MVTRSPRALSSRPRLEAVRPLPRLDATPPVTNKCLVCARRDASKGRLPWSVRGGKPAVHGPSGYQPTITLGGSATVSAIASLAASCRRPVVRASQGRVRARLAFPRLPDAAPLRGRQPFLVGLPEPGQGDRAGDGQAEPEHRHAAE